MADNRDTDAKVDRLFALLDQAATAICKGDAHATELFLREAVATAETLPKKDPALLKLPKLRNACRELSAVDSLGLCMRCGAEQGKPCRMTR